MQLLMKVLIVDDNAQMRQMVKFYLNGVAEETRECADGAEALDAYTEFQPDWVLMDWEMKRVDGLTATHGIMAAFPAARVLFVTQYDEDELRRAAQAAGACGYVLKENLLDVQHLLQTPEALSARCCSTPSLGGSAA